MHKTIDQLLHESCVLRLLHRVVVSVFTCMLSMIRLCILLFVLIYLHGGGCEIIQEAEAMLRIIRQQF